MSPLAERVLKRLRARHPDLVLAANEIAEASRVRLLDLVDVNVRTREAAAGRHAFWALLQKRFFLSRKEIAEMFELSSNTTVLRAESEKKEMRALADAVEQIAVFVERYLVENIEAYGDEQFHVRQLGAQIRAGAWRKKGKKDERS